MKILLLLACSLVAVLSAGETIQSGTVAVTATEDTAATITYDNIRAALVSGSSSSTYQYRIKTLGASTKSLKTSAPADVVLGTTVVVGTVSAANQTPNLSYTPTDDQFTLFPVTAARSIPAVTVATVEVLDVSGPTPTLLATVDLRIDIQGVADTREGVSGYYQSPTITQPDPIVVPRGGSVRMNYVELAARCGFVDKERDGAAEFAPLYPSGIGGSDGWSLELDNPPGALGGDGTFIRGTSPNLGVLDLFYYGNSSDYSTDSLTLSMPSNHPLGTFDLVRVGFGYDPDGLGPGANTVDTGLLLLRVTVVAAGGGGSGGGSGSGSGGCGLGAVSGLLMLAFAALALRLRVIG